MMIQQERVYLFDTTLRDGAQTSGIDFSLADKQAIAQALDHIGMDYIEGGWPGANPTDEAFFAVDPEFKQARFTAFGMTRRAGRSADNDPGLAGLIESKAPVVTIVGKTWDFHVHKALEISLDENLAMIGQSIQHLVRKGKEAILDAEHFFDGYKANPAFALACLQAAKQEGARWVVLCDTNGGTLPHEITKIIREITPHISGESLGIHAHNDTENAVANSLAAVEAGVRQVQGTINGLGERCGNANLISLIPSLVIKMGYDVGPVGQRLHQLTHLSRLLDERINRAPNRHQPYVGRSAFAHKGGLHVSAVLKDPTTYEHIRPELVGNERQVVISDQAGRSNLVARLSEMGVSIANDKLDLLLKEIKQKESEGYSFDGAEASFELMVHKLRGTLPNYFAIERFRVIDEHRHNALGQIVNESEATVWLKIDDEPLLNVAMGIGPVHAMDQAMRKGLQQIYPVLADMRLVDFKVRILPPRADASGTEAVTRVTIESTCGDANGDGKSNPRWLTVGVSDNIISASVQALGDAIRYRLYIAKAQ